MSKTVNLIILAASLLLIPITEAVTIEEIKIKVAGGVNLSSQYFPAKRLSNSTVQKPGPAVLLLSMCDPSSDKSEWVTLAGMLQDAGISALTLDYRGFGTSEGKRPTHLTTVAVAMPYWRKHWSADVEAAYGVLAKQKEVDTNRIGIAGASCGVFMGMDFTLNHPNVKTFVSLGGPVDKIQNEQLRKKGTLPILIIGGNEGPTLKWSNEIFVASNHTQTEMHLYKIVTHGTNIFDHHPKLQNQITHWFKDWL